MRTRRDLLVGMAFAPTIPMLARIAFAGEEKTAIAPDALSSSQLVYVTPIKSDGEESRCKAEIWFAYHEGHVYVVTPPDAWRSQAVRRGLTKARLWVGEFGVWTEADGAFRQAPELMATAAIETDADIQARVLAAMGEKYAETGWGAWGQRFRDGLTDGSRVMIGYVVDA